MLYDGFVISFGPTGPDGTQITVLDSPSGKGSGLFQPPSSLERTRSLLPGLWRDLAPRKLLPEPLSVRQIGRELFSSIFCGEIETLFEQSLTQVEQQNRGLRIELVFDLMQEGAAHLQSLPWEFLYRSMTQDFLALSRYTPIVRFLEVQRPITPAVPPLKLRVLLIAPQPSTLNPLRAHEECQRIKKALSPLANIEIIHLQRPTLSALREVLTTEEIHVVHFAGSAIYDGITGDGALAFEDERGNTELIKGDRLAFLLGNHGTIRLVFLNACDTARVDGQRNISPFRSVAISLVAGGIPAVIGMQFLISDSAAVHFSETFYQRLADGDPVDAATTEGRKAVYVRDPDSMEWGTPVLYTRTSDGMLFDVGSKPPKPRLLVFLCHSSADKEFVRNLYRRLTIDGHDVWLDEERILPGKVWEPEINRALRSSHAIIICLSNNSITKTGFVQKEIAIALDLLQQQPEDSIYLIPAKIEDCRHPDRLSHLQFVRIDEEKGYRRLLTALEQRARDLHLG